MFLAQHPCFSDGAYILYGHLHLAVTRRCNIRCNYCLPALNNHDQKPGVASRILRPKQAIERLKAILKKYFIEVVGIAGPGDSLFNGETFETFELINKEFPQIIKCLCTNGLKLAESIPRLKELGVNFITVTCNSLDPEVGSRIYDFVRNNGSLLRGSEAAAFLIQKQIQGITEAVKAGMNVKINTCLIPEINLKEMVALAKTYALLGARVMNIMPLIPLYKMRHMRPPNCQELRQLRQDCGRYIKQFCSCQQCRADVVDIRIRKDRTNEK